MRRNLPIHGAKLVGVRTWRQTIELGEKARSGGRARAGNAANGIVRGRVVFGPAANPEVRQRLAVR